VDIGEGIMILDFIENLEMPDTLKQKFSNEVQSLRHLQKGLQLLYLHTKDIEQKAQKRVNTGAWLESLPPEVQKSFKGKDVRFSSAGNSPALKGLPQDKVYCFFQWYSVSACDYVWLTGWIMTQVDSNCPKPWDYVNFVIPDVLWFRDKIGAHRAIARKHKKDTEADRAASVIFQLTFDNGRFWAPSWKLTIRRSGKQSTSTTKQPWSLTETHEKLGERYWPAKTPK